MASVAGGAGGAAAVADLAAPAAAAPVVDKDGFMDLREHISIADSTLLNAMENQTLHNVLKTGDDDTLYIESDADEQLLVTLSFKGAVKVHHIELGVRGDESRPTELRTFVNAPQLDFSDAETLTPVETFTLAAPKAGERALSVGVKFVKYQNVTALTLFFAANAGAETSIVRRISVFGKPRESMNMNELKKVG